MGKIDGKCISCQEHKLALPLDFCPFHCIMIHDQFQGLRNRDLRMSQPLADDYILSLIYYSALRPILSRTPWTVIRYFYLSFDQLLSFVFLLWTVLQYHSGLRSYRHLCIHPSCQCCLCYILGPPFVPRTSFIFIPSRWPSFVAIRYICYETPVIERHFNLIPFARIWFHLRDCQWALTKLLPFSRSPWSISGSMALWLPCAHATCTDVFSFWSLPLMTLTRTWVSLLSLVVADHTKVHSKRANDLVDYQLY